MTELQQLIQTVDQFIYFFMVFSFVICYATGFIAGNQR